MFQQPFKEVASAPFYLGTPQLLRDECEAAPTDSRKSYLSRLFQYIRGTPSQAPLFVLSECLEHQNGVKRERKEALGFVKFDLEERINTPFQINDVHRSR
jgi:hypothetical protein